MNIRMPSTITARYTPWLETGFDAPGTISLYFGRTEIGWFTVTPSQHDRLMSEINNDEKPELDELAAAFLASKLFEPRSETEGHA